MRRIVLTLILAVCILLPVIGVRADDLRYDNQETGYYATIRDDAGLLTDSEKTQLLSEMEGITKYANVGFFTTSTNSAQTKTYAKDCCYGLAGKEKASTVFVIDMYTREVYIYSTDPVYKTMSTAYANTITDNVYQYATDKKYYKCASEAFSQMYDVLRGFGIPMPMKHTGNALLALLLAAIISALIVLRVSIKKRASDTELLSGAIVNQKLYDANTIFLNQTRVYSPRQSSGGGGGRSGGGGGGGGGGGHSF